ncbi:MAG: TIGR04348 family glycosyltransferase [Propionibacteriales bacterium]|nr:TIGR04348 family glycosyltransferase [Propionibacteriales bacterium]
MILLVSPAAPGSANGNGVTADRWARVLRALGHDVVCADRYREGDYAALVALHARKSADAIRAFRSAHPDAPVVLALTGTDLYPDLASAGVDPDVLRMAARLVVLQPKGLQQLDSDLRDLGRVIVQSVPVIPPRPIRDDVFEVALLAHLRPVKDPLLAAAATRRLPAESQILITHVGSDLDPHLAEQARVEAAQNPRYDWLGELPRPDALNVLARSRLLVLTSRSEGGANVVSEALGAGVPVLSTAIPGSQGLLGDDYPGYFDVGDAAGLADLLRAVEEDRDGLYSELVERCEKLRDMVDPRRERAAWASLLGELGLSDSRKSRSAEPAADGSN